MEFIMQSKNISWENFWHFEKFYIDNQSKLSDSVVRQSIMEEDGNIRVRDKAPLPELNMPLKAA